MNRRFKSALTIILIFTMITGSFPASVYADTEDTLDYLFEDSLISPPEDDVLVVSDNSGEEEPEIINTDLDEIIQEDTSEPNVVLNYQDIDDTAPVSVGGDFRLGGELLTKYSSVDKGYVSPVRNQNPYGSCWAFSTIGAAESSLLRQNMADRDIIDLSERQLVYYFYNYKDIDDPLKNTLNDYMLMKASSGSNIYDNGGNVFLAGMFLANWSGGVGLESLVPYDGIAKELSEGSKLDASLCFEDFAHLQQIRCISQKNREQIQQAIVDYGSVSVSLYYDASYLNGYAFYNNVNTSTNHAVLIVGYDNDYSVENFKEGRRPSKNGAWLVKNSWGTNFGDNGYIWVSYEDTSLSDAYAFEYDAADNYDYNYHYDGGVCSKQKGYQTELNGTTYYTDVANVFTTTGKQSLEAVSIFLKSPDVQYSVDVYKNVTDKPTDGEKLFSTPIKGTTTNAGYYTIKLPKAVTLDANTRFSVVFSLLSTSDNSTFVYYDDNDTKTDWYENHTDSGKGVSFLGYHTNKNSKITWREEDSKDATFRIHAFSNDIESVDLNSVTLRTDTDSIYAGDGVNLTATLSPANTTYNSVEFELYSDEACTENVDADCYSVYKDSYDSAKGTLTARLTAKSHLKQGDYYIKATGAKKNGTKLTSTKKISVTNPYVSDFKESYGCYTNTSRNVYELDFKSIKTGTKVANSTFTSFTSSDTDVATVDGTGKVTVKAAGNTTVKAYIQGTEVASGSVTVNMIYPDGADISDDKLLYAFANYQKKLSDIKEQLQGIDGEYIWYFKDENTALNASDAKKVQEFPVCHLDKNTGEVVEKNIKVSISKIDAVKINNLPDKLWKDDEDTAFTCSINVVGAKLSQNIINSLKYSCTCSSNILGISGSNGSYLATPKEPGKATVNVGLYINRNGGDELLLSDSKTVEIKAPNGVELIEISDGREISIEPAKENVYNLNLLQKNCKSNTKKFVLRNINSDYVPSITTSNASVVKVGSYDEALGETQLLPVGCGKCELTVKFDDDKKTELEYKIRVVSYAQEYFTLDKSELSFNPAKIESAINLNLINSMDAIIDNVSLLDSKGNTIGGYKLDYTSGYDSVNDKMNSLINIAYDGMAASTTGYLKVDWHVFGYDGIKCAPLTFKLKLKVAKSVPKVTVAMTTKVDAFYKKTPGIITVTAEGGTINRVVLKNGNTKSDFGFFGELKAPANEDLGTKVNLNVNINNIDAIGNKKGIVEVYFNDYSEPVKKSVTIKTCTQNIVLSSTKGTIYSSDSVDETRKIYISLKNINTGKEEAIELGAYVYLDSAFSDYYTMAIESLDGKSYIVLTSKDGKTKSSKGDKIKFTFKNANWFSEKNYTFNVTSKDLSKVSLKLKSKTITMYTYDALLCKDMNKAVYYDALSVTGGCMSKDLLKNVSIEATGKKKAPDDSIKLSFSNGYVKAVFGSNLPTVGSYTYNIVLPKDVVGSKKDVTTTVTVKVITVSNINKCIKLTKKGSIDVLNRNNTFVTVTPKLSSVPDTTEYSQKVSLSGQDAGYFTIDEYDPASGAVKLKLKDKQTVKLKYAYKVNLHYGLVLNGSTEATDIVTNDISIKLTQGKVKLYVTCDTTYFQSACDKQLVNMDIVPLNSGQDALDFSRLEITNGKQSFSVEKAGFDKAMLTYVPTKDFKKGKTYTLKFKLYLADAATNSTPVSFSVKVKII